MTHPLHAVSRTWWLVPVVVVAALGTALVLTARETRAYRASTSVVVVMNAQVVSSVRDTIDGLANLDRRNVVATLARLTHSTDVLRVAASRVPIDEALARRYQVRSIVAPNTNIIEIEVTGPDPDVALKFAAEIGAISASQTAELYGIYRMKVLDEARGSSKPIRPDVRRNLVVAAMLGLVGGLVLAAGVDWARRSAGAARRA